MRGNTDVVVNLVQVPRLGIQEINSSPECFTMKIKFVAAFFTALCASLAVPAFASGYGGTTARSSQSGGLVTVMPRGDIHARH